MSKRNNREIEVNYNKDSKSLFISFTQSKTVERDKVDDNIGIWKDDKHKILSIEIRDFNQYIKHHTVRYGFDTKRPNHTVAGITTATYS